MEKYLILFIILIVLYYLHMCWIDSLVDAKIRKESFSNSAGSGMDDSTAIQALGSIAKDLMSGGGLKVPGDSSLVGGLKVQGDTSFAGGLKVQGDTSVAGVANFAKDIKVADRNILAELNAINTRLKELSGRNIFAELDDLKANSVRKDKKYGIRSARGGYLSDQGGWKPKPPTAGHWEVMYMDELPF